MKSVKKRIVGFIIIMLFIMSSNCFCATTKNRYQDFEYKYNEKYKGIEITDYKGNDSKVVIPTVIDGVSVNSIGYKAFYNKDKIEDIVIPESVKYFDNRCFESTGIKNIKMPHEIEYMGEGIFYSCYSLQEVDMPNNINLIPACTFNECLALEKVNNISQVKEIGEEAFFGCESLKSMDLSSLSKLKSIQEGAFRDCRNLKEIKLPAKLTTIKSDAFIYCISLEKVSFQKGSNLSRIGYGAFQKCVSLKAITLPKKVKIIEKNAFYDCKRLKTVKFQGKMPKIAGGAFSKINSKATFYVPNKYKSQYTSVLKKNKWFKSTMKIKKL